MTNGVEVTITDATDQEKATRGTLFSMLSDGNPFAFIRVEGKGETEEDFELIITMESSFGVEDSQILRHVLQVALDSVPK